jgi:hypothetical protein
MSSHDKVDSNWLSVLLVLYNNEHDDVQIWKQIMKSKDTIVELISGAQVLWVTC